MIAYDLCCEKDHRFEAWFKDAASFERQAKRKLVSCTTCGSSKVRKALTAPALAGTRSQNRSERAAAKSYANHPDAGQAAELLHKLGELRRHIEANADDVGNAFAEEARKIHYGEAEKRSIYGQASDEEAKSLIEEGVEFARIPWVRRADS
jgi:hypothetical protein